MNIERSHIFLKKNLLFNEQNDAFNKMKIINHLIERIKQGDNTMNELSFPPSVSKEYVYGCTVQKRNEIFTFLINELRTQIAIIEEEKEIIIRRFYNSTKNVEMPKEIIEDNEASIEEKMKILQILKETSQIEWIRPPVYITRKVNVTRSKKMIKLLQIA